MKLRVPGKIRKAGHGLLSLWLAFHVFSVFMAPASMPPASPLLSEARERVLPYLQALFLNHGYHYFAPDPGASTLIAWSIPRENDVPVRGRFPDPSMRPRLLYHRYFMLAENIDSFPDEMQDEVYLAYARHFATRHQAPAISLSRVLHHPSSISRVLAGGRLTDPETFSEEPLETYWFGAPEQSAAAVGF